MKPLLRANKEDSVSFASLDHFTTEQGAFLNMFGREEIREIVATLKPDQTLQYIARMYNMHDVFADLIRLSGPAEIKIMTYSVTEFPLRILSQFLDKQIITKLDFLLDFTVSRTPELKQFAGYFANRIRFIDTHAKLLLIKNERWHIVHVGSANFTRNNRFEMGTIITHEKQYNQFDTWFEKLFNNASN